MLVTAVVENVTDRPFADPEGIGKELPMTAPRNGFGTHESDSTGGA
jgi:hypothetical protein